MQELVQRTWKEFMIAPKSASSGKAEQWVIPSDIEQLSGLPKSSVVVKNGESIAWRRRGGIAKWLGSLSDRPCGLRDFVVAGHEPQEVLGEVCVVVESRVRLV